MRFAVTLTLRPKWYALSIDHQFQLARDEIDNLCIEHIHVLAELTKSWNVHFHGIMNAPYERVIYDIFRKSKIIGFVCVKELDGSNRWADYCYKDVHKSQSEMLEAEIIRGEDRIRDMAYYLT